MKTKYESFKNPLKAFRPKWKFFLYYCGTSRAPIGSYKALYMGPSWLMVHHKNEIQFISANMEDVKNWCYKNSK